MHDLKNSGKLERDTLNLRMFMEIIKEITLPAKYCTCKKKKKTRIHTSSKESKKNRENLETRSKG